METLNTNYILKWDWDQSWSQDVTFTTEYMGLEPDTDAQTCRHGNGTEPKR